MAGAVANRAEACRSREHSGVDAALDRLRADGFSVRDEDLVRLSPLGFDHINMLGRYAFVLPDIVARGELRPLRNPSLANDDEG